jgi:hypothetical protein
MAGSGQQAAFARYPLLAGIAVTCAALVYRLCRARPGTAPHLARSDSRADHPWAWFRPGSGKKPAWAAWRAEPSRRSPATDAVQGGLGLKTISPRTIQAPPAVLRQSSLQPTYNLWFWAWRRGSTQAPCARSQRQKTLTEQEDADSGGLLLIRSFRPQAQSPRPRKETWPRVSTESPRLHQGPHHLIRGSPEDAASRATSCGFKKKAW